MTDPVSGAVSPSSQTIGIRDGWLWFSAGFARYRRNPILMMFWVMTYWTMLGLVGLMPVVGDVLVAALAPVLMVGVLAGCRELDRDLMPSFTVMFSGLGARLQPLMGLGLIHFALTIGALALTAFWDGGALLQYMARGTLGSPELPMPNPAEMSATGLIVALLAYVPVLLAFAYAPLLVAWRNFGLGKALFFSLVASWRAWRGLIGFLAALVVFGILLPSLAMMLLVSLGLDDTLVTSLVIVPIVAILAPTVVSGFYTSYGRVLPAATAEGSSPQ